MEFADFVEEEWTARPIPDRKNNGHADIASNVMEQFKFMQVSGSGNQPQIQMEDLAKSFMTTLDMNKNDAEYSERLEKLTRQLNVMRMKPGEPVHINQTSSAADGGAAASFAAAPPQKPKDTERSSSKSPKRKESRPDRFLGRGHRSRSKSPMARFAKAAANGLRSLSPRRRNTEKAQSPLASQGNSSDLDEFFETHSTIDSFTFDSPNPKHAQKPSTESGNTAQKQPPTPSTSGRPPLATVHISEVKTTYGNSPIISPQKQTTFKFDRQQDKFNLGSSPPKKSKVGSPSKKTRSPTNESPSIAQPSHQTNATPLQGSPLTVEGPTPSPFVPSINTQTNVGGAPTLFASPVPDVFHAPETFIPSSGSRGIPTPHNIMQNDQQSDATARRQTAPPFMASAATSAAESFRKSTSAIPKTPLDQEAVGISTTVPDTSDTAETLIKKKRRNTATPNFGVAISSPKFNVDLRNRNPNISKPKGKRGNTLRKAFGNAQASTKTTGRPSFVFGMDEIKEVRTDDTAPTEAESPSNGSAVSMDTSPMPSPAPSRSNSGAGVSQVSNPPAQFNLGVNGDVKRRSKRNENKLRRSQLQRNQLANNINMFGPSRSTFDLNHNQIQHEAKLSSIRMDIMALKDLGKTCYMDAKYQESTRLYGQAIEKFKFELFTHVACKDLLALLLSNRAAALLMIGAYDSAVEDCRNGILYVTDPSNTDIGNISPDANPSLRPKLYTRMGKSYLKLGKVDDAEGAFSEAVASATAIQEFHQKLGVVGMHDGLEHIKTDAMMGQTDAWRLRKISKKINGLKERISLKKGNSRDLTIECIGLIKEALSTANGCHDLHLGKVKLLAELNRWREVFNHCERFAASNTKYDGCLIGDLSSKNPFPGVGVAKYLRSDHFGDTKDDEMKGAEMKLKQNAAEEALLRLPYSMMPFYLRSLRLNEFYEVEAACLLRLDKYMHEQIEVTRNRDLISSHFLWLPEERAKMQCTKIERNAADDLFTNGHYREAALRYAECLRIDSGGGQNPSGCRLHAVLHCNRAACFMMLKKFHDAMTEATAALRIYPRYVKALLRRARCYSRVERTREALNDYNHWLDMVKRARENKRNPVVGDLVFDGPHKVKAKDMVDVQAERDDLVKQIAKAEVDERSRQARDRVQEQSRKFQSEHFQYNASKFPSHKEANKRRENFYSSQHSSRKWDSFKDRTQSSRQEQPKAQKTRKDEYGYKSKNDEYSYKSKNRSNKSQGSLGDKNDFYAVLGIERRATVEEIKKAYKKMALKHHPDKNKDNPTAADNFLCIKDAYETLKDPNARRKYDSKFRRRGY